MPSAPELAKKNPFRTLIQPTPIDADIEPSQFDEVLPELPQNVKAIFISAPPSFTAPISGVVSTESKMPIWASSYYDEWDAFDLAIAVSTRAVEITESIARLYGIDTSIVTMEEMLNLIPIVQCVNCSEQYERHFVRWSEAVESRQRHRFVPVSGELLDVIEKIEEGQKTRRLTGSRWWAKNDEKEEWNRCKRCDFKDTLDNLKVHISEIHDITTVTVSDW
ncbi:hypothetical protein PQX77_020581 [Marasmius sp. AFHP31]|nr:hypothetical protein PQX77_020581 [Marasmius sp. AFHP31]